MGRGQPEYRYASVAGSLLRRNDPAPSQRRVPIVPSASFHFHSHFSNEHPDADVHVGAYSHRFGYSEHDSNKHPDVDAYADSYSYADVHSFKHSDADSDTDVHAVANTHHDGS